MNTEQLKQIWKQEETFPHSSVFCWFLYVL